MALPQILRLMSMFGGLNDGEENQPLMQLPTRPIADLNLPQVELQDPPEYNPYARMQELYKPRTDISRQYTDSLKNVPQFDGVSNMRKVAAGITAGLLGLNNPKLGIETGLNVGLAPYERKVNEYNLRTNALAKGAAEEDRYNTNQRLIASDTVNKEQTQFKIDEAERKNKKTEELTQQKVDISRERAEVYRFKAEHPEYKVLMPKGGNITFFNPQDPNKIVETKLPTGTLSDEEAIELRSNKAIEEIHERGNEAVRNTEVRGKEARSTKSTPSATSSTAVNDSETIREVRDARGNLVSTTTNKNIRNPETLKKQAATQWLKDHKQIVSPANIDAVIKAGKVK